jgi:hypothetical protein
MHINDTIAERTKLYGDFRDNAAISQEIKSAMAGGRNWLDMSPHHREALEAIAGKVARILSGDPEHFDSWHDIAGYATLVADTLKS